MYSRRTTSVYPLVLTVTGYLLLVGVAACAARGVPRSDPRLARLLDDRQTGLEEAQVLKEVAVLSWWDDGESELAHRKGLHSGRAMEVFGGEQ